MDGEEEEGSSDDEGKVKTLAEVDFSSSDSEEDLGELIKGWYDCCKLSVLLHSMINLMKCPVNPAMLHSPHSFHEYGYRWGCQSIFK